MSKSKRKLPPLEALTSQFHYDSDTGLFFRKKKNTTWTRVGEPAGYICATHGYRFLHVNGYGSYRAHMIAWKMHHKEEPRGDIDHINRVKSDNRISNLRIASHAENMRNKTDYSNNKSGLRGVSWKKSSGRWVAQVTHNGRTFYAGLHDTVEEAHEAYKRVRARLLADDS